MTAMLAIESAEEEGPRDIWTLPETHLAPGEVVITREPRCVTTLLGSCVAVVLYASRPRMAAMCHALLPRASCHRVEGGSRLRFADEAIHQMTTVFADHGVAPRMIEAKVFGGARVLSASGDGFATFDVGAKNVLAAESCLARAGIRISACCVGGERGRKIHLNTTNGEVLVRLLGRKHP